MLQPRVDTLAEPQRRPWPELRRTPRAFVLYGGTALALRLGHRQSDDFDFFSTEPFDPTHLAAGVPYLRQSRIIQRQSNALTCLLDRGGPVRVSFFGGLPLNRVEDPQRASGPDINVASLLDLAATKAEVVQSRASAKDYLDVDALIHRGNVTLSEALSAAKAVYGHPFNPMLALKALVFFGDGDLHTVPIDVRKRLVQSVRDVDLERIPVIGSRPGLTSERPGS